MRFFKVDKRKKAKTQLLDLLEVTYRNWKEADLLAGPKWPVSEHNSYQAAKAEAYLSSWTNLRDFAIAHGDLDPSEVDARLRSLLGKQ